MQTGLSFTAQTLNLFTEIAWRNLHAEAHALAHDAKRLQRWHRLRSWEHAELEKLALESKSLAEALEHYRARAGWGWGNGDNNYTDFKYDPNQRRAPAGSSNGGQWVSDGGGGSGSDGGSSIGKPERRIQVGASGNDANHGKPAAEEHSWTKRKRLKYHYDKHGKDFNSSSSSDYASQAEKFKQSAAKKNVPSFKDKNGLTKIYDPKTNTYGSYDTNGKTKTFFKPKDGAKYFQDEMARELPKGGKIIRPLPSSASSGGGGRGGGGGGGAVDISKPDRNRLKPYDF